MRWWSYRDARSKQGPVARAPASAEVRVLQHEIPYRSATRGTRTASGADGDAWPTSGRAAVMHEVRDRAAARRAAGLDAAPDRGARRPPRRSAALPEPVSVRPGASVVKRLVRRLTAWQVDPIVGQVNRMREALVEAFEQADP